MGGVASVSVSSRNATKASLLLLLLLLLLAYFWCDEFQVVIERTSDFWF